MFKDYYEILGVDPKATSEEIKSAYREQAFQYHPDRNPNNSEAKKKFLEISEAYRVLNDPIERKKFHHRYLSKTAPSRKPEITSYELTRQKRSARYGRGRYSPRVRYRGSTYKGPVRSTKKKARRPNYYRVDEEDTLAKNIFSEKYREELEMRAREQELGYSWYSRVMASVAVMAIIFCMGLVLDYYLPRKVESTIVLSQYQVPWSFSAPGLINVSTENCRFRLGRAYASWVPAGKQVKVARTIFSRTPVLVTTQFYAQERQLETSGGVYGGLTFYLIFIVILLGITTLYFRQYTMMASYTGTAIILLSLIILTSL
jgi:curved DNA-binding protein CbpA